LIVPRLREDDLLNKNFEGIISANREKGDKSLRIIQAQRYRNINIFTNSELTPKLIKKFCPIDNESEELLKSAIQRFNLSGRAYDRLIKLARTIADLEGASEITATHIAQSIQYRNFIEPSMASF
jgi:magnesium chelatase family protein